MYIVYTNVCRFEGKLAYLAAFTSNILGCVTKTCQKFSVLQFAGERMGFLGIDWYLIATNLRSAKLESLRMAIGFIMQLH